MIQQIGEIVIVGLAERTDRWQRCIEILKENKINKVTHYQTQKDPVDVYRHATIDFLDLLKIKRGNDLVFFEDDFELKEGWEEVLKKAWEDLPKDFDMLYLGANLTKTPKRITSNLVRVRGAWCLHGVVMSAKFIEYFLKTFDINRRIVIDEWCRTIAEERKFYMTYPMICFQRKSYSDFVKKEVWYDIFNNKYYKEL
jgi:hypothetical protein